MKLRSKYLVNTVITYTVFAVLMGLLFPVNKWLFLAGEALLIVSLAVHLWFFRSLFQPISNITQGVSLLQNQDFNTRLTETGQPDVDGIIVVYNRMVELLRRERTTIEETNLFLDQLINASPMGIITLDAQGCVSRVNPFGQQLLQSITGIPNVVGRHVAEQKGRFWDDLNALTEGSSAVIKINGVLQVRIQRAHFYSLSVKRTFYTVEELSDVIIKAERLAYEKVIRTMTHEVNNSVAAVNSILECLAEPTDGALPQNVEPIDIALQRNIALSRFMSNYSDLVKLPLPDLVNHDLVALANRTVLLMQSMAKQKGVDIFADFTTSEWLCRVDPIQMEQVLINLVKNSVEATDAGGKVVLGLNHHMGEIRVTDTGCGLSHEVMEQLFTPFFSTKPKGQGVGLTFVREVLRNHGFTFGFSGKQGETTFIISLSSKR